jgi:DNA-binding NtrC family response regulator
MPVLIEGQTGTGKELVASMLHRMSGRTGGFVAFNVCALGDSMFEDALFGHARGAFTGAMSDSLGYLREANGGTVFLDEISGLPLGLQAKLLRAIETGVFRPIGASRDAQSNFRTVAATNEPLESLVVAGRFRPDLAHRLRGIVLSVPALAERREDIEVLAEHFARQARPDETVAITWQALDLLRVWPWPGNVRELKQIVEAAVVLGANVIDADVLTAVLATRSAPVDPSVVTSSLGERAELLVALERSGWDVDRIAAAMKVHRSTVYRKLKRLGIAIPSTGRRDAHEPPQGNLRLLRGSVSIARQHRALSSRRNDAAPWRTRRLSFDSRSSFTSNQRSLSHVSRDSRTSLCDDATARIDIQTLMH